VLPQVQLQQQQQLHRAAASKNKNNRDAVDCVHSESRDGTPIIAPVDDDDDENENRYIDEQLDPFMHDSAHANIEFSDVEEPPQMTRTTRSQSRVKENSLPPPPPLMDDTPKQAIKRNRKKVTEKAVRRKRVVVHEEAMSEDD
jgi:hypothetical protein